MIICRDILCGDFRSFIKSENKKVRYKTGESCACRRQRSAYAGNSEKTDNDKIDEILDKYSKK
ncbi:MAG: hypothetical protein FWH10_04615 [Oscillospiraceae bacterium]|nr:hypothetical protein [Oscillospiraceae bacterium]